MRLFLAFFLLFSLKLEALSVRDAVRLSLERNPVVKGAEYALYSQGEREKKAFARMLPRLDFDYSYTHLRDEPYARFPFKVSIGKRQDVRWGVQATWPAFTGFYLRTLREMEKIGVDMHSFKKKAAEVSVAYAARAAYYGVLVARERLETARESVRQLKAHLRDAESFYENGMVAYNDVLKARVALSRAVEEETKALEELNTAWVRLNLVIRSDDPFSRHSLEDGLSTGVERKILPFDELCRLALSQRPDVKALEMGVERARLGIKLAKSRYYPWVTLFARYERHGDDMAARDNPHTNDENLAVGFRVSLPLFDWGERRYSVEEAKGELEVWKSRLEELKDSVRLDVQRAYASVKVALKNISVAKAAVEHAREDLRITRLQYAQHLASSSDVIDSERSYTEARNNYNAALYRYHMAISELARACGLVWTHRLFVSGSSNER